MIVGHTMKALEVTIDGQLIGVYAAPDEGPWLATMANIPRTYMRAHIMTKTSTESWQWQLPDIQEGECIEFRIIDADPSDIPPASYARKLTAEESNEGD